MSALTEESRVGQKLRELRRQLKLSQDEVAHAMGGGMFQTQVSQIELGVVKLATEAKRFLKLGRIYGLSPNELTRYLGWDAPGESALEDNPYWLLLQQLIQSLPESEQETLLKRLMTLARTHVQVNKLNGPVHSANNSS